MNNKTKVYILSADVEVDFKISYSEIENWNHYMKRHNSLVENARKFISICEFIGAVYTLEDFVDGANLDIISLENNFIFITDLY